MITAPVLAAAANSPVWLGHRLWDETRIALFQSSVDERHATRQQREHPSRVSFGQAWVEDSVLEIFRDQVLRFRHIFTRDVEEGSLAALERGMLPALTALKTHNGSVWRWNRACFGVTEGRPHLRIEVRALPAGPSIVDEVANVAFFFGLLHAATQSASPVKPNLPFDQCHANFFSAARHGLYASLAWPGVGQRTASELIESRLLPAAREGLRAAGISEGDGYLDIIGDRARLKRNGAFWALASYERLAGRTEKKDQALVLALLHGQTSGKPVHTWPLASEADAARAVVTVEALMSRDLFTVRPDDLLDLAANLMDWRHVRHVPVEDARGRLEGILSHRDLIHYFANPHRQPARVRDLMRTEARTVSPHTSARDALELLRRHQIGCLPVVDTDGRLIGLVTESDFLRLLNLG
jgi:CBS domain-containing protein